MHTTNTPARRAAQQPGTDTPKPFHIIHHREPDGTIHALCGKKLAPANSSKTALKQCTIPCIACDAAKILMRVKP